MYLRTFVILLTFCFSWYLLGNSANVIPVPITQHLSFFPKTIDGYYLVNAFQSSEEIEEALGVDEYIDYSYVNSSKSSINLYVAYYSAVGISGAYHSPKNCMPGGGWGIDSIKTLKLPVGIEEKKSSSVTEMLIRKGDSYKIVLFWYQNRGKIIASEYGEKIHLVKDALFEGRRDGTFVRIIASVQDENLEHERKRAQEFAQTTMVLLEDFLPGSQL